MSCLMFALCSNPSQFTADGQKMVKKEGENSVGEVAVAEKMETETK